MNDFTSVSLCRTSWKIFLKSRQNVTKTFVITERYSVNPPYTQQQSTESALSLTGQEWSSRRCGWWCRGRCPPRSLPSTARPAPSACSAAGCRRAPGTAASAWQCWCPRRCAWSGTESTAPVWRAARSYRWSPGNSTIRGWYLEHWIQSMLIPLQCQTRTSH